MLAPPCARGMVHRVHPHLEQKALSFGDPLEVSFRVYVRTSSSPDVIWTLALGYFAIYCIHLLSQ
jgi:hypothetical protein